MRNKRTPNEIIIYDNYAEIILYDHYGEERERTQIDIDDIKKIKKYKWYLGYDGYCRSGDKPIYLHRIIMNCPNNKDIDHIDGKPLNNRKYNLREATNSQNMMNRKLQSNNTSGVTGVIWDKHKEKWRAQIKINNKNICLGRFINFDEAVQVRKDAEKEYFGEFTPQRKLV